jgi:parallel beta-helix repeat protein
MRTRTALLAALAIAALPAPAAARTMHVDPGESIQAAIDEARSGDTVRVHPGTYKDTTEDCSTCALQIKRNNIELVGENDPSRVVLQAKSGQDTGIQVAKTKVDGCLKNDGRRVNGSLIRGLTVKGFDENGVLHFCVDNWRITNVVATGNDEYGFFPLFSGKGRLDHSRARGANDTGFYVGQSHDVRMDHNTAVDNVSGFEIENSVRVVAEDNLGHDNTAGLLSFALPNLQVKVNRNNVIRRNVFHHNNRKNTCGDEDDTVCNVPPGSGIIMVATDKNVVKNNKVKNNKTDGIATVSYCILLGGEDCNPDIEPNPDDNTIVGNTVTGNGKNPVDPYKPIAADLIWDGTGKGNCWGGNVFGKSVPDDLPSCQ